MHFLPIHIAIYYALVLYTIQPIDSRSWCFSGTQGRFQRKEHNCSGIRGDSTWGLGRNSIYHTGNLEILTHIVLQFHEKLKKLKLSTEAGAPFTAGRNAGGQSKVCQPE